MTLSVYVWNAVIYISTHRPEIIHTIHNVGMYLLVNACNDVGMQGCPYLEMAASIYLHGLCVYACVGVFNKGRRFRFIRHLNKKGETLNYFLSSGSSIMTISHALQVRVLLIFYFSKISFPHYFCFVFSVIKAVKRQVWTFESAAVLAETCWRRVY